MEQYKNGDILYGDDFDIHQIEQWYREEEEAYALLEGEYITQENFEYTNIDQMFGFPFIEHTIYDKVLGLGASWGYEFIPIIDRIKSLYIVEDRKSVV